MVPRLGAISDDVPELEAMKALLIARHLPAISRQVARTSAVVAFAKSHVGVSAVAGSALAATRGAGRRAAPIRMVEKGLSGKGGDGMKDGISVAGEILLSHFHGAWNTTSVKRLHLPPAMRIGDEVRHIWVETLHLGSSGMPRHGLRHFLRIYQIGSRLRRSDGWCKFAVDAAVVDGLKDHRIRFRAGRNDRWSVV